MSSVISSPVTVSTAEIHEAKLPFSTFVAEPVIDVTLQSTAIASGLSLKRPLEEIDMLPATKKLCVNEGPPTPHGLRRAIAALSAPCARRKLPCSKRAPRNQDEHHLKTLAKSSMLGFLRQGMSANDVMSHPDILHLAAQAFEVEDLNLWDILDATEKEFARELRSPYM
jgi:hypothetical protein